MSLISEETIKEFEAWAKGNEDKNIFPQINEGEDSYYNNKKSEDIGLTQYSFVNMAELKQAIEIYSELPTDSQILEKLVVEVCKNKSSCKAQIDVDRENQERKADAKTCDNLITEKNIGDFYGWARENKDESIFPLISEGEDSYYITRNSEETYLMEYSFHNMAWLKESLKKYAGLSSDLQMLKKLTVTICQNRFIGNLQIHEDRISREKKEVQDGKKTLPEFIYVF